MVNTGKKIPFLLLFCLLLTVAVVKAQENPAPNFKAVAFDFFVIFNPNSVVPEVEKAFPHRSSEFTQMWRSKQFEYCFLRSITGRHADFFKITEDALVYTANALKLNLSPENRTNLLNAYLKLEPWPDAVDALQKLKAAGVRVVVLSNFSEKMLRANIEHAGMNNLFDELISTDANDSFKPEPQAYALGTKYLKLDKSEIAFAAFGGWDAFGGRNFGFKTYWVNRLGLPVEELGLKPDEVVNDMQGLLKLVLNHP